MLTSSTTTRSASSGRSWSVPALPARSQLEQAVERPGGQPGRLLHPLGGAAGGGGEQRAQPLGAGEGEDGAQGVRLARARPAGQDRDRGGERHPHRRLLLRRQRHAVLRRQPAERRRPVGRREGPRHAGVRRRRRGSAGGRPAPTRRGRRGAQRRARCSSSPRAATTSPVAASAAIAAVDRRSIARAASAAARPARLGQERVPLVPGRAERVQHARLQPRRGVRGDADRLGDRVGGLEADAPDLARQPVRLLPHHPPAVVAEPLVDAHRQRGRDAVALQRRHHLADVPLLRPGRGDAPRPHLADAGHLGQPLGRRRRSTSKVASPKASTMRPAITGPMPLTSPLPR